MATVGIAAEDQGVVVDQFTATLGEDGRTVGETRPVLLAAVGREPSDAAAFRGDGATDRGVVGSSRVKRRPVAAEKPIQRLSNTAGSEKKLPEAPGSVF